MCYDISFTVSIKQLLDYFPDLIFDNQLDFDFDIPQNKVHINGHVFPSHPIIYAHRSFTVPHCSLMEWGVIPKSVVDEEAYKSQRANMLNIRSERILDDPRSYWNEIPNNRCLVPVTGYYENHKFSKPGYKTAQNVPYYFELNSQPIFYLPGLYSVTSLIDKSTGEMKKRATFGILTKVATALMAQLHNKKPDDPRMVCMLPLELSKKWISPKLSESEYREIIGYNIGNENIKFHPVYAIRSQTPRPDGKEKNELYVWEGMPEIIL